MATFNLHVRQNFNFDNLDDAVAKIKELGVTNFTIDAWESEVQAPVSVSPPVVTLEAPMSDPVPTTDATPQENPVIPPPVQ